MELASKGYVAVELYPILPTFAPEGKFLIGQIRIIAICCKKTNKRRKGMAAFPALSL
jgi:hypothetical protein